MDNLDLLDDVSWTDADRICAESYDDNFLLYYLSVIGRVPLLKGRKEEKKLFSKLRCLEEKIEDLRERLKICRSEGLRRSTKEQIDELDIKAQAVREEIIKANLKLVIFVAKRFFGEAYASAADIIQEGNIGLIRAVNKFDPNKGTKFSTYAIWWIRQSISRYINDSLRTVRLPVHMIERRASIRSKFRSIAGLVDKKEALEYAAEQLGMPSKKIEEILSIFAPELSIYDKNSKGLVIADILVDQTADTFSDANKKETIKIVQECLEECLTKREQLILKMRYGIEGREYTLEEIGNRLGLTRERVRQLQQRALRKLRNSSLLFIFKS